MTVAELKVRLANLPEEREVKILMSDDFYGVSTVTLINENGTDWTQDAKYVVAICSDEEL